MDPAPVPSRALGQSLVAFGLISDKELEQALAEHDRHGMPLGEIIVQRGFASRYAIALALGEQSSLAFQDESEEIGKASRGEGTDEKRVAANGNAARGSEAEDKVVRLVSERNEHDREEVPTGPEPEARDQRTELSVARRSGAHGLQGRLARKLDAYLARTAAQLDERGETLLERAAALDQESDRLAVAEAKLDERSRRLSELDLGDEESAAQVDQLLGRIAERDARLEESEQARQRAARELAQVRANLDEQQRRLSELLDRGVRQEREAGQLQARLEAAEAALAHREQLLGDLQEKSERQAADLAALREAGEEGAARIEELQEDLEGKRAGVAELERVLRDREREVAELKADAERREVKLGQQEQSLNGLRERAARMEGEVGPLRARLEAAAAALAHREQLLGELEERSGRQSADLATLRAAGEEGAARIEELQKDLERRRAAVAELERVLRDREREVAELKADAERREAELARRGAVLAKLQIKLASSTPQSSAAHLEAGGRQTGSWQMETPPDPHSSGHLLLVPALGTYVLVERAGPPPAVGSEVLDGEGAGRRFVVSKISRSPLPDDPRFCAYLQSSG